MDTIEFGGGVYHGDHYGNVGVYTDLYGQTYAGQREGAYAHGLGVYNGCDGLTSFGTFIGRYTYSGQYADGLKHGYVETHYANGDVGYDLCERGKYVRSPRVRPNGDRVRASRSMPAADGYWLPGD
jgi:hypothetical protein